MPETVFFSGDHIYLNGKTERTLTPNGYIQDNDLYFYIKDYQGNVRAVLNRANEPVELTGYYPYGAPMAATTAESVQPYKYGAKELDRENGLNWYDSHARFYAPLIGRTPTQDPMAEKYPHLSPYLWCAANPVKFLDDNGKELSVSGTRNNIDLTISQINSITPGVEFFINDSQAHVSYMVFDKNSLDDNSRLMIKIADDKSVKTMIRAVDTHYFARKEIFGGAFWGCTINEDNTVSTLNVVNNLDIAKIEQYAKKGTSVLHEVSESYYAGKIALALKSDVQPAIKNNSFWKNFVYNIAHILAMPQVPLYSTKYTDSENKAHEITFIYDKRNNPVVIYSK